MKGRVRNAKRKAIVDFYMQNVEENLNKLEQEWEPLSDSQKRYLTQRRKDLQDSPYILGWLYKPTEEELAEEKKKVTKKKTTRKKPATSKANKGATEKPKTTRKKPAVKKEKPATTRKKKPSSPQSKTKPPSKRKPKG